MANTVDDRVVAMSFENERFKSGVSETISGLDRLKAALNFQGSAKGFEELDAAANRVDLSHISGSVDQINNRFSLMNIAGIAALAGIATKAAAVGAQLVKSLTLDPITEGFHNYETQINAVQTIAANTGLRGASGMAEINKVLAQLNQYANLTIYNFSDMAKSIGTFTAAGVGLRDSTEAIKGIANLAAMSGATAEQASGAMYQLSQALAAGSVKLQDWNSVVNAGIGGQVFQKALFTTAEAMGTIKNVHLGETFDEWRAAGNNFRQSLSAGQQQVTHTVSALARAQADGANLIKQAQQSAADSLRTAAQNVQQAQQNVVDTTRQGSRDIANAIQQEQATIAQSAQNVQQAIDAVRQARLKLIEAMKPPSHDELQAAQDQVTQTKLDAADSSRAIADAHEQQTRAAQDLVFAQQQLAATQANTKSTPDQIIMAQRAVQDAQQKVIDLSDATARAHLQQDSAARAVDSAEQALQATREKGTKQDQNVKNAQDALTQAIQQYRDARVKAQQDIARAEQNVQDVRIKTAENEKQAGQQLANAEVSQARTIEQAQKSVADAHTRAAAEVKKAFDAMNPPKAGRSLPSWLTSAVLTQTLKQFAGDMTTAQLKAQGFTDQQISHIELMGKTASQAATNVKTFSQLTQSLREEVGTAWAAVFKTIFGGLGDATAMFSKVHTVIEAALTNPIYAFNNLLKDWSSLGGRTKLIDAISHAWTDLSKVLGAVKQAWRDVFPSETGSHLYDLTVKFDELMKRLTPTPKTLDEIRRTFAGLFSVFDVGHHVVSEIFNILFKLFGLVGGPASGGFLGIAAHVGDLLVHFDKLIKSGALLSTFFGGLAADIRNPARLFDQIKSAIDKLFGGFFPGGLSHALDDLEKKLFPLAGSTGALSKVWQSFTTAMQEAAKAIQPMIKNVEKLFDAVINFLTNTFKNLNFDNVLHAIDTGLLGGIFVMFKKFFEGTKLPKVIGGGVFKSIRGVFDSLTGSLKVMQTDIKANAILQIAIAVGVLSASILAISLIDPKRLNGALGGLSVAFGSLIAATKVLTAGIQGMAFAKLPVIAAGLDLLAAAVLILSGAMKVMSTMNWKDLEKGLVGVSALLAAISVAVIPISANSAGMISAGLGITAVAVGIRILSGAVREFQGMSWADIAKGLGAVGAMLVGIGLSARLFPTGMIAIGLGLSAVAVGIRILVKAIHELGDENISHLVKGLAAMGAALAIIGIAMDAMPPGLLLQSVGLVAVGVALKIIASALETFGDSRYNSVGKGLLSLAGALAILAIGLDAMSGTLVGAAALGVATAAIVALVPALALLGHMSLATIATALISLAAAIAVIGLAGAAISPLTPALLGLGAALLMIGGGLALAGGGVALFGIGLAALAASGPIAIAAIVKAITTFVTALPKILSNAITGLLQVADALAKSAPDFAKAMEKIFESIIQMIVHVMPSVLQAFDVLIHGLIAVITKELPFLVDAGLAMIVAILNGIKKHMGHLLNAAVGVITTFVDGLANNMPRLVTSGTHLLINFLDGISRNIHMIVNAVVNLIVHFVGAVADNVWRVAKAGLNLLTHFLQAILSGEKLLINAAVKLLTNFLDGVASAIPKVRTSATHMMKVFIDNLVQGALTLTNTAADAVVTFLNGIATAINTHSQQIWNAGWNIAWSIIMGMVHGLENLAHKVVSKIGDIITSLPSAALDLLESFSPSRVFMRIGGHIVDGLYLGLANNEHKPARAVESMTKRMINTINGMTGAIASSINVKDPVITPVLDLSKVKASSKLLPGYISPKATVDINANIVRASGRVPNPTSLNAADSAQVGDSAPSSVTFVQNNNSPKSLSEIEIYRQTNNQISQLKRLPALAGR